MVSELESFFFEGMLDGYASGEEPLKDPNLPGWKRYVYCRGDLKLLDMWCSGSNTLLSQGDTIIYHNGYPMWGMQYRGWYADAAIPTLKEVLQRTYRDKNFAGCRGVSFVEPFGGFTYENAFSGTFTEFSGLETISKERSTVYGYHEYCGGVWLPKP